MRIERTIGSDYKLNDCCNSRWVIHEYGIAQPGEYWIFEPKFNDQLTNISLVKPDEDGKIKITVIAGVSKDKIHATITNNILTVKIDKSDDINERIYKYRLISELGEPLYNPVIEQATLIDGTLRLVISPGTVKEIQIEN